MAVTLLVTTDELASYMGACWSGADTAAAAEILADVQVALQDHLGVPLTVQKFTDTITVSAPSGWSGISGGRYVHSLFFPHTPVVSLISVAVNGVDADITNVTLEEWGISAYDLGVGNNGTIVATYNAGIDATTDEFAGLRAKIKRAAAREMQRRGDRAPGSKRVSDEGSAVEYVSPEDVFTPQELRSLARYKRRKVLAF